MHYYLPAFLDATMMGCLAVYFIHLWRRTRSGNMKIGWWPWFERHATAFTAFFCLLAIFSIGHSFWSIRDKKLNDFAQVILTDLKNRIEQQPAHPEGSIFTRESVYVTGSNDHLLLTLCHHADLRGDEADRRTINALLDRWAEQTETLSKTWANELPCYVPNCFRWTTSYRLNDGTVIERTVGL